MIGLVVVSHSAVLARSVAELARSVSETGLTVAHAGGVGDNREQFGTDATEILSAIEAVMSEDGVLVLMDLGSAILSAEMALELLSPEHASRVRLCPAPLVEGAVAAGALIAAGAPMDQVDAEARTALDAKTGQLSAVAGDGTHAPTETTSQEAAERADTPSAGGVTRRFVVSRRFVVRNRHGLHVRPAAKFVQTVSRFDVEVLVRNRTSGKGPVNGRSLSRIATLGVLRDHEIEVEVSGPDAAQALVALEALVQARFGEPEDDAAATAEEAPRGETERDARHDAAALPGAPEIDGAAGCIGISAGYAVGTAYRIEEETPIVRNDRVDDTTQELARLATAQEHVAAEIERQLPSLRGRAPAEAQILEAHLLVLKDPDLNAEATERILADQCSAEQAWWETVQTTADAYRGLEDAYLRRRADDVIDVGRRVVRALGGSGGSEESEESTDTRAAGAAAMTTANGTAPADAIIVVAEDLRPSQVAMLPAERVAGIVTRTGSASSHSAILARALGYPAVSGYSAIGQVRNGDRIAIDGGSGIVILHPDDTTVGRFSSLRAREREKQIQAQESARRPAQTTDGIQIEITANVGEPGSAARAAEQGAEGIGVLRTEFLFLDRSTPPDESEQEREISAIVEAFDGRPVIVRTLDVGGDKDLPFLQLPREMNPYLGVRGVRLCLEAPKLFMPHARAILRAAHHGNVSIMIPMVALREEIAAVRAQFEAAHRSLAAEGTANRWPVSLGIMIETPAAVFAAAKLADACDFFSIGTNDLTQYIMAAERGNARLSSIADTFHPAVLRAIEQTQRAADAAGISCSVCGEFAGTREGAAVLIGLGIHKLSMNGPAIPEIKTFIRSLNGAELRTAAAAALQTVTAAEARALFRRFGI